MCCKICQILLLKFGGRLFKEIFVKAPLKQRLTIEGEYASPPFPPPVTGAGSDHTEQTHLAALHSDLFPVCYPGRLRKAVQEGSIKAN